MEQPTPNWQPITALPMIGALIEGMLEDTEAQYQTLLQAKERPPVFLSGKHRR